MSSRNSKEDFHAYLATQKLKSTRQREIILDEFLQAGEHLSTRSSTCACASSIRISAMRRCTAP